MNELSLRNAKLLITNLGLGIDTVIYEYDNHIYYFKNLINEYEILKKEKEERFFSLCDHKWEKERENIPYGELYYVCKKCGFCK